MQFRVLCCQNDVKGRQEEPVARDNKSNDNPSCLTRLTIVVILALSSQKNKNSFAISRKKDGQHYKKDHIDTSIHPREIELREVIRATYLFFNLLRNIVALHIEKKELCCVHYYLCCNVPVGGLPSVKVVDALCPSWGCTSGYFGLI